MSFFTYINTKFRMVSEGKKFSELNAGRIFGQKKQKPKTYFPKIRPGRIFGKFRYYFHVLHNVGSPLLSYVLVEIEILALKKLIIS